MERRRRLLDCTVLVVLAAVSRFLCRSRYLYDIDSVNFAMALGRFDPQVHQPHPPGYFLYVLLGRWVLPLFQDANTALVAVSIAAGCAAVVAIYRLAEAWYGRSAAVFAGILFLFSPLAWFHGIVALTYILELFFSAAIGYFCWQARQRPACLPAAAALLAIAAGFRQSSPLFLGPLVAFAAWRLPRKYLAWGAGTFVLTALLWFAPMVREGGGAGAYFGSLHQLWTTVAGRRSVFSTNIALSVARFLTTFGIYGVCFGAASWLAFVGRPGDPEARQRRLFTWVWLLPGLLFFTFVFLNWVNSGYLLVMAPPVFAHLGARAAGLWRSPGLSLPARLAVAGCVAGANVALFLFAPLYCTLRSVRAFEADLIAVCSAARSVADPSDTMIVGFDSHFLGYRHAAYYLPEYLTVQYPEVRFPQGPRVFAVQDRDTRLLDRLPIERFPRFVLFPLPPDKEYHEYQVRIRQRFPEGALQSHIAGGREFLSGRSEDLAYLFPSAASVKGGQRR